MAESPLMVVEGVSAFYDQFRALDDIDIVVGAGEIVSIIGANGAGKSTLLKAIIGQADRVEGRILFAGENILGRATAAIVAAGIMLVPEGRRLFPSLTVEENLRLGWDVGRRGEFGFDAVWRLFPSLRNEGDRRRRRCPAGSSRWWRSAARCWPIQNCCCATRSASASPRSWSTSFTR
jgi:branched-chain amino acid transport system ATP-binding protein